MLNARRFVPIVIVVGILLRIGWVAWTQCAGVAQASDAAEYHHFALSISAGHGYAPLFEVGDRIVYGMPTSYWPVGYPGFLGILYSITGAHVLAGLIANIALQTATLLLLYNVARTLFNSERVARVALLIVALHPNSIAYSSLLMSENLFIPLMLGATALMLKGRGVWKWGIAAGIVYGITALVKPQALFLPAITFAVLWLGARGGAASMRPPWKLALAANVMMLLVLFPWTLRNYGLYGKHGIISTNDGINLLIGNNPWADGAYNDSALADAMMVAHYHFVGWKIPAGFMHESQGPDSTSREDIANADARAAAMEYIRDSTLSDLKLLPKKFWHLYRADAEGFTLNLRGLLYSEAPGSSTINLLKIAAEVYWIALLIGAAYAIVTWLRRRPRARIAMPSLPFWMIMYFTAIPLVYFGDGRFHAPAIPWIAMIAAGGVREGMRE
jgi:4-amino-4-deoxy-L-arabinose transferase-like glycosyltransferase